MMKLTSNLVFGLALVSATGFWALALSGHLAPVPSAATPAPQVPAQESIATVAPSIEKEPADQKIEAVSAPVEEVSAPATPAKTLVSKSVKPRSKRPAQVKTRDRAAGEKS